MRVNVRLFAGARDRAGRATVELELPEAGTVAELKSALADALPALAPILPRMRIAVGAEYVADDATIGPDAEVAVIPPVSGGSPRPRPSRRR